MYLNEKLGDLLRIEMGRLVLIQVSHVLSKITSRGFTIIIRILRKLKK